MTEPQPPSDPHHRHCLELFARLSEYLDRELDEIQCQKIEDHLRQCAPCQACLATLKQTVVLCRQMPAQPVSGDFARRLRAAIQEMAAVAMAGQR